MSHTQSRQGTHLRTCSAYTIHTSCTHTYWWAHAVARTVGRTLSLQAYTWPRHTCRKHTAPARPRTRPGSHTPAFPVPACFSGNSALRSPPPRPEVLVVFLACLVSAPFPLLLPAQDRPPAPSRGPGHPLPHRHSRGDSRPLPGPRIFPLATCG